MIIDAMVNKVEDGNTYFTLDDVGAYVIIPKDSKDFLVGEEVQLIIQDN